MPSSQGAIGAGMILSLSVKVPLISSAMSVSAVRPYTPASPFPSRGTRTCLNEQVDRRLPLFLSSVYLCHHADCMFGDAFPKPLLHGEPVTDNSKCPFLSLAGKKSQNNSPLTSDGRKNKHEPGTEAEFKGIYEGSAFSVGRSCCFRGFFKREFFYPRTFQEPSQSALIY